MTKTWDTKNKILKMLSEKRMTLTQISEQLDLAQSTVNQHLKELLSINAIRLVENPYVVKWKYYEANPSFNVEKERGIEIRLPTNPIFKVIPIVVALAVIAWLFLLYSNQPNVQSGIAAGVVPAGATIFSISDSPPSASTVSAVNISVASAQIHSTTTGKWYTILNTTKTFNLVNLNNISQVVTAANLPYGTYNELDLEVQNVTAVVDNQSEAVFLPSGDLRIFGNFTISNSTNTVSWVNIDVNLAQSLHFTGNGRIIMLPVINLEARNGSALSVDSNGIVQVNSFGRIALHVMEGMGLDGKMVSGQIPVPAAAHVSITSAGGVVVTSVSPANSTVVIRTPHKLIIIVNLNSSTAVNITGESNNSTSVRVITINQSHGFGQSTGYKNGSVICNGDSCWSDVDLTVNTMFPFNMWKACMCPYIAATTGCNCGEANSVFPHNISITGNVIPGNITVPMPPQLPCGYCPGALTNSNGIYKCTPRNDSDQVWPSFRCVFTGRGHFGMGAGIGR